MYHPMLDFVIEPLSIFFELFSQNRKESDAGQKDCYYAAMQPKKNERQISRKAPKKIYFVPALLVVVTLLVFWPAIHCGFLNYDDDGYVTNNAHVLAGLNLPGITWAFRTFDTANWHPLTWLSLMFDAQFSEKAAYFHFVNVLLHAVNSVLLFLFLQKLTGAIWRSAFVATAFAIHPLHVESVVWISERKDVLSGFFFMLTLLAYAHFVEQLKIKNPKSKKFYSLALLFFACGLMSKPMLVTLPFVLLLLDFWPLNRIQNSRLGIRNLFFEKIPFSILSAASCVVTFVAQKHGEAVQTLAAFPIGTRIENATISYSTYLAKTFWPVNLAVPYPYSSNWPALEILFAIVFIFGVSIAAFVGAKKFPFLFVGWFWFLGMLVPVIGLVQVGKQAMADRYTYLPLIGIFIIVVWGIGEVMRRWNLPKEIIAAVAIAILVACAIQTRQQISYWQNSETLFKHAIAVTKNNAEAWDHLGTYYLHNEGDVADAADCFQKTVALAPDEISGRVNLGSIYLLQDKPDEAGQQLTKALQIDPSNADANCDLGFLLASHKQFADAITHYDKAIEKKPDFASAYHNRGLAYAAENNWTNAIQDYRSALQFDPNHASTHTHLGIALIHIGQTNEAIAELNCAIELNPNDTEAAQHLQSLQK
jgi:tetratricopeptide (TPR) repeat protein